jgi:hypothetical protein
MPNTLEPWLLPGYTAHGPRPFKEARTYAAYDITNMERAVLIAMSNSSLSVADALFTSGFSPHSFGTVLADPPWRFTNRTGKMAPEHHRLSRYPTLTLQEIAALPLAQLVLPASHLYLWVPNALLAEGLEVMQRWGFTYKTNGPARRGVLFSQRDRAGLVRRTRPYAHVGAGAPSGKPHCQPKARTLSQTGCCLRSH